MLRNNWVDHPHYLKKALCPSSLPVNNAGACCIPLRRRGLLKRPPSYVLNCSHALVAVVIKLWKKIIDKRCTKLELLRFDASLSASRLEHETHSVAIRAWSAYLHNRADLAWIRAKIISDVWTWRLFEFFLRPRPKSKYLRPWQNAFNLLNLPWNCYFTALRRGRLVVRLAFQYAIWVSDTV